MYQRWERLNGWAATGGNRILTTNGKWRLSAIRDDPAVTDPGASSTGMGGVETVKGVIVGGIRGSDPDQLVFT